MQREEQRRRSRAAILEAAGALFERHGFAAASLSDVAAELGMVRGTIHFHFATKEGLADSLVAHFDEVWTALDVEAQSASASPQEQAISFSHSLIDALRKDPRLRGALRILRERRPGTGDADVAQRLVDLARRALGDDLAHSSAQALAAGLWGAIDLTLLGLASDPHRLVDDIWAPLPTM